MLRMKHEMEPGRAVFGEFVEPVRPADEIKIPTPSASSGQALTAKNAVRMGPPGSSTNETRIDEVVVTYFAKPHSYTTDDIIEISAHGSPVVLRHIVELCVAAGARLAEPGEFTMRAFLNGRIDLTQAEAVRDLIDSQTLYQAKVAAQQLEGALSRRLQPIKQKLVELIAMLEAGIDFAEDDVSVMPDATILEHIAAVRDPLEQLSASFAYGKIVHEGLTLAIVGRPNVGKSSLFNRLVERERAIVTATPGTTRDLVSETVAIGGIPVKLVDTAGIRDALDEAESMGIRKSMEALADADLVLIVLDASQGQQRKIRNSCGWPRTGPGSSWEISPDLGIRVRSQPGQESAGSYFSRYRRRHQRTARGDSAAHWRRGWSTRGVWFPDQCSPSGIDSGIAGGAGCGEERCRRKSAARDAADGSLQWAAPARQHHGRDHDG